MSFLSHGRGNRNPGMYYNWDTERLARALFIASVEYADMSGSSKMLPIVREWVASGTADDLGNEQSQAVLGESRQETELHIPVALSDWIAVQAYDREGTG
jgi:hypothetical protein